MGQQRQADRRRLDAGSAAAPRRRRGCRATCSSCDPRSPPSRRARNAWRTPRPPSRSWPERRTSRGAGRPGPTRRPGRRTPSPGGPARSQCTRCASRGDRGPGGCPTPARRGARPARAGSPAGRRLPGAVRIPATLGEDRAHGGGIQPRHVAEARGVGRSEVQVPVNRVHRPRPRAAARSTPRPTGWTRRPRRSPAGGSTLRASMSVGEERRLGRASARQSWPVATARSSSGSSTSVTFWT